MLTHIFTRVFAAGFAVGFSLLAAANYYSYRVNIEGSRGSCFDCAIPCGVPFTLYRTEGFVISEGFIWEGVFGNVAVAVLSGIALGLLGERLFPAKRSFD